MEKFVNRVVERQDDVKAPQCCDLCDATEFQRVSEIDRKGKPLQTDVCLRCGLVRHHRIPSEAELAEYYARQYRVDYHDEETPSSRRVMRAWKNGQRIVNQLKSFLSPGAKLLEIGAGIGCTVRVFQQSGFDAHGIEPHRGFQSYANNQLHSNVANCSLGDLPVQPVHDMVVLVHVIEHLRSPRQSLLQIRELIKDGGLFYVECPNLGAPFATPDRLFHYAHIHNFTPQTLALLAERCGFEVVKQFGQKDDVNLQLLLRKVAVPNNWQSPQPGAAATLAAMNRYGQVAYHLRPSYLRRRLAQVGSYALEHAVANHFVRRLIA